MPMAIPAVASAVTSFGLTASASLYAATGLYLSAAAISATAVAAANVAISVAVSALMQPKVGTSGPVDSYKSDPAAPVRGVMGRMAIGGNRIFKRTWGRTNVYLTSVALLSLGPCQAVEQFKANDQFVSFGQSQGGASGKYAGHMWMTYRYGLPGTSALTPPQGVFIENPKLTAWTSQHRADGHVTAMWTLAQAEDVQKRDLYTQGEPDALWIGRWMKVWDPRQDSTYPGGSGSQRRDQWSTWTYSENPYLHALAWIRGHAKLNADGTVDRTKRIAGVGAPERAIDIANYVEGANIADANGWKIAGEWSTSDDKWQVLAAMLQAGGGVPLNRGAQISCMVNTPRASIYTYTRNDLVGGATVKALKARRDRKNTVVPRYRSEAHGWEIVPAGAVTSSVYRTEDRGEPRTIEIEYSYVTSAKQAGELGAYDVANMREGLETSLPSKPHLLGLRAGDAFTTDLPELGLVAQKFIVQRRAFDPQTGVVTLDVLSETDAKHAWALGQTENPPPTPSLVGVDPDYVAPPELPEWTVVVRPPAGDGSQQPGFEIIGGSPAADASSVVMEHGQSPTGPWQQFYDGALKTTGRVPIVGLQPGETYYVAVRYRRDSSGALSDRTIYGPYTAPSLTAGDTAAVAGYPASDLLKDVRDVQDLAGSTSQAVAGLEQVYGDTVSAAQSAADAAAAQAGAIQAKADALIASSLATAERVEAGKKATEAAGSAAASLQSKNDAAVSASTSTQKATDAAGSAASALQQAGLAAGSATAAGNSATAASGSASTASTKATEAETAAAASLAHSVTATTARDGAADLFYRQFPPVLDPVGRLGYEGYGPIFGPTAAWPTPYISEEAAGAFTNKEFRHTRMIPKVVGRRYRVECWVFSYATNVAFTAKRHDFEDEAGGSIRFRGQLEPCEAGAPYVTPAGLAFYLVAGEFTIPADDQAFTRPYIEAATNNGAPSDGRVHIGGIKITDVTERTAANGYANASATSAASAAASETATEQSASAASEAKNLAETARGQAQTFRDEAADSVTTAAGSAATATQQAGIATDAKNAAAGSASAALTSRNQASSFADEAETAASVSTSQKLLAEAARDQALKALLEQGRLNLVRRTRATAGQVIATSEGLSGWGFSMVGTGSGSQERRITVGPLKQNTPYSLSFMARRLAGAGSLPITFDLFPDTLPQRDFDIQSDAWTRYTWENFFSAHDDMTLPSVVARFFRPNMEAGVNVEIAAVKLEEGTTATAWTPSPFDAADSVTAAATSAANASASDTTAGQKASAAEGSATTAATRAGEAQSYRDQAATSENNAAGSASLAAQQAGIATDARNAADDAAEAAAGSAATASSKADEAGVQADAALASQVTASASRDQALKALLEQGRTNLVRRTRATAGQVVATSEGLSGWGFSMVGTGSGSQERSIAVGPLKQNTPYSLSFWARRLAGAGSRPITFDLFPDTLPERAFDIQSNVWTRYTWENFSSAHADMTLSTVRARFFRPNMEAGVNVEIAAVKIEEGTTATAWTPSPFDAADSASAAAISAANAAASDTAAGQKAAAADGSAVTAATRAGEAKGFRDQSATSETNAAGSAAAASQSAGTAAEARNQAVEAKDQSAAAAATSQQARSDASAFAASAQISADLAASVNRLRGNLIRNSTGADGLRLWGGALSSYLVPTNAGFGPRFETKLNGTQTIFSDYIDVDGSKPFVLSGVLYRNATGGFMVADVAWEKADGTTVYSARIFRGENAGADSAPLSVGLTSPAGAVRARVRIFTENVTGNTYCGALRLKLERGELPATGWTDDATDAGLAASLSITAGVAADVQSRLASARFEVIAAAGNDPAQLLIRADTSGSLARMVASSIGFANVVGGQVIEAMKLIGGEVFFMRPIYIDVGSSRLIVGPGNGWVLWFGGNDKNAAAATRTNGIFCLGTDSKIYHGSAELGSGVTQAKIASFRGSVGRSAPLMVAGQTESVTVPQNGRFIVEMTNGLTSSFSDSAGGLLRLYISKDGAETQLGSLNVNAGGGDHYFDLSALNMDVVHNFAGAVKFVVKTNGNGPSTDGQGTVSGTLKATYYPN